MQLNKLEYPYKLLDLKVTKPGTLHRLPLPYWISIDHGEKYVSFSPPRKENI